MASNFDKERDKLKKALNELVALNQIANAINALMSVEEITQIIVEHSIKWVKSSQGAVFLLKEDEKQVDKFKTFIREHSPSSEGIAFHLNESITGWMIKNKTILISNNPETDDQFKWMRLSQAGIQSILSAPLLSRNNLIGSLVLFNKRDPEGFTEDDKRFLGIVGSQVAKVIENAHLREKEVKLDAMEQEIKVAQSIQRGFLPKSGVRLSSCEVSGINSPAKEVSGDYYDIIKIDDDKVFLSIGDVSGKGMPAALLMANAQAVLRSQLSETAEVNLPKLAQSLNYLIFQFTESDQFITALFGLFDSGNNSFQYINAGHEPPIVVRKNGAIDVYKSADLVIGVIPEVDYNLNKIVLEKEDLLFACTDGISEAYNENDEQFGVERLHELLKRCKKLDPCEICDEIISTLAKFRGNALQSDDITSIVLSANMD